MKKTYLIAIAFGILISSCTETKEKTGERKEAKGGRKYGGILRVNETEPVQTLYPYSILDLVSSHVASQVYEGLVKFDSRDLSIKPSLASSWEIDSSGTQYTFFLKKGVFFHDDPCFKGGKGRELTAHDIKYSFEQLCTPGLYNNSFVSTFKDRVLGANKYYEAAEEGKPDFDLEGVAVINDYTIQVTLERPSLSFLNILTHSSTFIVPVEAIEKYANMARIGTGAFRFADDKYSEKELLLVRNELYHGVDSFGNTLPYLDTLLFSFISTKKEELEAFQAGKLDVVVGLPSESVNDVIEKQIADFQKHPPVYVIDRSPEMSTQYYDLNSITSVFKDKKVRQAFAYAIDREKIITGVLNGEGYGPGVNGISPPSFKGYDITQIEGYTFNPELAKKLLAEAGYPEGKNFPAVKLTLNSGGAKNTKVALEVTTQLRNVLNVNVELEIVSFAQKIEAARYLKGDMFRAAWIADYPNPENFLNLFYGKTVPASLDEPSFPNISRYQNPEFDKLYEMGMNAKTQEESYKYFLEAEKLLMKDAPVLVLYYDENYKLYQGTVLGFYSNPMKYWDFSEVYKKPLEEQERKMQQPTEKK